MNVNHSFGAALPSLSKVYDDPISANLVNSQNFVPQTLATMEASTILDEEQLFQIASQSPEILKVWIRELKEREQAVMIREKNIEDEVQRRLQCYLISQGMDESTTTKNTGNLRRSFFTLTQEEPVVDQVTSCLSSNLTSALTSDSTDTTSMGCNTIPILSTNSESSIDTTSLPSCATTSSLLSPSTNSPSSRSTSTTAKLMQQPPISPLRGKDMLPIQQQNQQQPLIRSQMSTNSPTVLGKIKGGKANVSPSVAPHSMSSPSKVRKPPTYPQCALDGSMIKARLRLEDDDPNKEKIHDFVDIIVNNIQCAGNSSGGAVMDKENVRLIKMVAPKTFAIDVATDTADLPSSEIKPMQENLEIGLLRPVNRGESQNPRERDWFKIHFSLIEAMSTIRQDCLSMLPMIKIIERIVEDVVHFIRTFHQAGITRIQTIRKLLLDNSKHCHRLQQSLSDLFSLLGDIQGKEISAHSKLFEYRTFFEGFQRDQALPRLFTDFPEFEECFHSFTFCQGCVSDIHKRLLAVKDCCQNNDILCLFIASPSNQSVLSQDIFPPSVDLPIELQSIGKEGGEALVYMLMQQGGGSELALSGNEAIGRLRTANESLEHYSQRLEIQVVASEREIKVCERVIEDLEQELLYALRSRDKTPGAILFFSLLHDPTYVPALQQISLQLTKLRSFIVHQTVDMDFMTLRKRMQVCLSHLPTIDKVIERYAILYKQWSSHRIQFFAERKLRGNAADNLSSCPLCFRDLAIAQNTTGASAAGAAAVGGGGSDSNSHHHPNPNHSPNHHNEYRKNKK